MRKRALFIVGLVLMSVARAYAYDDHDFQVWNTDTEELKINASSRLALEEEFRWGDNAEEFYYHHYDLGFFYDAGKHVNIGMGYRQIFEKKSGVFKAENAPYGTATLSWEAAGFKVDDRSRLEYRHFDYQTDSWRYRNKITVKAPWKFTKWEIQPYAADEIFLGLNGINLNQNRVSAGLGFKIIKRLKGEIYYLLQSSKSPKTCLWKDTHVLGAKLKFSF
jgi:hypothetical protein